MKSFTHFCREHMDAPMDQHGQLLSTFKVSMAEFIDDLTDITAFDVVEVTQDDDDPTKVMLKFQRNENSGD